MQDKLLVPSPRELLGFQWENVAGLNPWPWESQCWVMEEPCVDSSQRLDCICNDSTIKLASVPAFTARRGLWNSFWEI
jgi:hypothetical protein